MSSVKTAALQINCTPTTLFGLRLKILGSVRDALICPFHEYKEKRFLKTRGLKQDRLRSDISKKAYLKRNGCVGSGDDNGQALEDVAPI